MTFDQSQDAFRGHKTCETADAYLDRAFHYKADYTIGDDIFFNAVGEVASWLSASDEHLRGFEAVKANARYLAQVIRGGDLASPNHPLPHRALPPAVKRGHRDAHVCADVFLPSHGHHAHDPPLPVGERDQITG